MQAFSDSATARPRGFGTSAVIRLVAFGVIGWGLAALIIRAANRAGLFHGVAELGLFALCLPIAWGTAMLLRAARVPPEQMVPAMSISLIAALFLDGIALTTTPWLYGASQDALLPAAAWLLFGVGAFLVAAFLEARRV